MVWGWIIASVMIQFVAFSMAELCSSMPTAVNTIHEDSTNSQGGLYYASAVLAPEGWGPLAAVHLPKEWPNFEVDHGLEQFPWPSHWSRKC